MRWGRPVIVVAVLVALAGLLAACADSPPPRRAMVATANPHATEAAARVLAAGGNALDAAVAAQMVLGLAEPQSSGIGGGLFLLHWDAARREVAAWDGRERAPLSATPALFLTPLGEPMAWEDAATGGLAVGVPGAVAALWEAHRAHGRLPWTALFDDAVRLAEEGFAVSPRLAAAIAEAPDLADGDEARALYFLPEPDSRGVPRPLPVGHLLKNPAYAGTLRRIAEHGPDGFYRGPVAEAVVAAVLGAETPGFMTYTDLGSYQAVRRDPVCIFYRAHRVCGMPPPTSGGLTTLMMLALLEPYRLAGLDPAGVMAAHLLAQAGRLAFADRARYMADSDYVEVPVSGLLDRTYLVARARLIHPGRDMAEARPGNPPAASRPARAADAGLVEHGTSHLAIVDGDGNAVSMTSSVERPFGARIVAAGFVLNNQLTDFAFRPTSGGTPVINRVEGGKRPRSSMSPTLVFGPDGALFAAVGSPGGTRIIGYTVRAVTGLVDWGLTMQQAVSLPHVLNRNGVTEIEEWTSDGGLQATLLEVSKLAAPLGEMGHKVEIGPLTSGLHGIRIVDGVMDGGADPRREGTVTEVELP